MSTNGNKISQENYVSPAKTGQAPSSHSVAIGSFLQVAQMTQRKTRREIVETLANKTKSPAAGKRKKRRSAIESKTKTHMNLSVEKAPGYEIKIQYSPGITSTATLRICLWLLQILKSDTSVSAKKLCVYEIGGRLN